MKDRLLEIIKYKTGGKQTEFATLMGWSPQYLAKLLRGNIGLTPVMTIFYTLPEINPRWFLFGEGEMLEVGRLYELQRKTFSEAEKLLRLETFLPVMTPEEIHTFEQAVKNSRVPEYSPDTLISLQERATIREKQLNAKFSNAQAKSDELCRQRTAKKS